MGFFAIFFAMLAGDVGVWLLGNRHLRSQPGRYTRLARWFWSAYMGAIFLYPIALLVLSMMGIAGARRKLDFIPASIVASIFTWHLLVLPLTLIAWLLAGFGAAGGRRVHRWFKRRRRANHSTPPPADVEVDARRLSRRQLLVAATVAVPPLLTAATTAWGMRTSSNFRIRQIEVPVPGLPAALSGMVIAHLSDVHVGKWTSGPILRRIVQATNDLGADVVAFTGDLIDFSLDDLTQGLEMISQLRPPVFLCEGNHDAIENRGRFEHETKGSGARLLVGESEFFTHNGQTVQMMGLPWARSEAMLENFTQNLGGFRSLKAFPILLAHHPHAFDYAPAAGFPLVLSGHTHGGQIMLTRDFGAGSLMFRYVSGLYRHPASSLVVSNGAGNWYPLRMNAPAEILRLTLRAG